MNISGCMSQVYSTPGGPTIVQDAVQKTQYDVEIYKLKAEQELATMKLQHELEKARRKEMWTVNKPLILEKLDELSKMMKDVRELMYF
jgi:hypothetical protein